MFVGASGKHGNKCLRNKCHWYNQTVYANINIISLSEYLLELSRTKAINSINLTECFGGDIGEQQEEH